MKKFRKPPDLFYQCVVRPVQVEFSQVVPVSEDEERLLFCNLTNTVSTSTHAPKITKAHR